MRAASDEGERQHNTTTHLPLTRVLHKTGGPTPTALHLSSCLGFGNGIKPVCPRKPMIVILLSLQLTVQACGTQLSLSDCWVALVCRPHRVIGATESAMLRVTPLCAILVIMVRDNLILHIAWGIAAFTTMTPKESLSVARMTQLFDWWLGCWSAGLH